VHASAVGDQVVAVGMAQSERTYIMAQGLSVAL
jgi:hypothetical protein